MVLGLISMNPNGFKNYFAKRFYKRYPGDNGEVRIMKALVNYPSIILGKMDCRYIGK